MIDCPYCEHEMEDPHSDNWMEMVGFLKFDYDCEKCGKEFEIHVEFDPVFYEYKKDTPKTNQENGDKNE